MNESKGKNSKKIVTSINAKPKFNKDNIKVTKTNIFNKKYVRLAMVLLVILIVIILITTMNKKIDINVETNISALDSSKYSFEISSLYNRDGEEDKFLKEMNKIQTLIGTYLITNSTLNQNSFSDLVKKLNDEINNEYSSSLNLTKSIYYNGKYSIDEAGNLKFKFSNKKIEPNWINSDNLERYIIFN